MIVVTAAVPTAAIDATSEVAVAVLSRISLTTATAGVDVDVLLRRRTFVVDVAYGLGKTRDISVRLSKVAGSVPYRRRFLFTGGFA